MFNLPEPAHIDAPNDPKVIHAFVVDHVRDLWTIADISRVEDNLHNRLRILREREQDPELIRAALVLCADRRREIDAASVSAQPAQHGNATTGT